MHEIERKFLVLSDAFKKEAQTTTRITQGYLSTDPERTVRVVVCASFLKASERTKNLRSISCIRCAKADFFGCLLQNRE